MKWYSTISWAPELELHYQIQFSVIQRKVLFFVGLGDLTPAQRIKSEYSKPRQKNLELC